MKKIITLALSLTIMSAAGRSFSELNLKLYNNIPFSVVIDNNPCKFSGNIYKIPGLTPGKHYLKVAVKSPSVSWNYFPTFKTIYSGFIFIPANAKIYSIINAYGSYVILAKLPMLGANDLPNSEEYSWSDSYEDTDNFGYSEPPTATYYSPVITQPDLIALISVINNATFESSKLQVAKHAIATNNFRAQQVSQILKLFTFESSKLEIAKLAYSKTINKECYFLVNDSFSFESSIEELNKYILG